MSLNKNHINRIYRIYLYLYLYKMENNTNEYFKTDENKLINKKYIRWIKKINNCLEVCSKSNGCVVGKNTHRICKLYTPDSYNKLNGLFE
jgi:hypothetical protein